MVAINRQFIDKLVCLVYDYKYDNNSSPLSLILGPREYILFNETLAQLNGEASGIEYTHFMGIPIKIMAMSGISLEISAQDVSRLSQEELCRTLHLVQN